MDELEEYRQELVNQWTEVHKKSMFTLLILLALRRQPMWSKEVEKWCKDTAGWEISERGLHRTLKRMHRLGLIEYRDTKAPKTGIMRKTYSLSKLGAEVLIEINKVSLKYLRSYEFSAKFKISSK